MRWRVTVAGVLMLLLGHAVGLAHEVVTFPSGFYRYADTVEREGRKILGFRWDVYMFAQVEQESRWQPRARSPVGATGLTQFMPSTRQAVERKYGVSGSIYDPAHAARLQALLMRENLRRCGAVFEGFHNIWACALRTYNGSPAAFWAEWRAAGRPDAVAEMRGTCRRRRYSYCVENWQYPIKIRALRVKYAARRGVHGI